MNESYLLFKLVFKHFLQPGYIKINDDGPIDIEGGCYQVPVRPLADPGGGTRSGCYIHLPVFQVMALKPGPCQLAVRAPIIAVHDNAAVG